MILNKKIIVVTGGIATGKSTVSRILSERGYEVLDSDKIVHELYHRGSIIYTELVKKFGMEILDEKGEIDRKKLVKIVFLSDDNTKAINRIVHKAVVEEINKKIEKSSEKIVFLDIPLIIEEIDNLKKYGLVYDEIWLVYADRKTQLERLLLRDDRGIEESVKIIDAQMDIEEKKKYADRIIDNSSILENLILNVENLLKIQNLRN